MRKAFSEHFVGELQRQKSLWADCIFVLDTNVLLDLYRFSDSAREALFKVMASLGERLWIPYQVAEEYFENRLSVIEAQSKAYAESISALKIAKEKFNSGARHPFVSENIFNQFISSYDLMINELVQKRDTYTSYVNDDIVKAKIGTLLNGRLGQPYSEEQLLELASEGEKRYLENVPPGFQDGGKMPEATTSKLRLKKFGDLILWKQVIEKAVADKRPVILVTGEKKDDWWLKSNKNLVSALPALTKEFMNAVNKDFYLYSTDRFLIKANEYLEQNTSDVVVDEVRAVNKAGSDREEDLQNSFLDSWVRREEGDSNFWLSDKSTSAFDVAKVKSLWWEVEEDEELKLQRVEKLNSLIAHRKFIVGKISALRLNLDRFAGERENILGVLQNIPMSSSSLDLKKIETLQEKVTALDSMIAKYHMELVALDEEGQEVRSYISSLKKTIRGDGL